MRILESIEVLVEHVKKLPRMNKIVMESSLRGSILKWQKVVNGGEELGGSDCELCQSYASNTIPLINELCKDCPISILTGKQFCRGTPYIKFIKYKSLGNEEMKRKQAKRMLNLLNGIYHNLFPENKNV